MCEELTEDGHGDTAGSDLSADFVGDGALVGAAILSGGFLEAECVDNLVRKNLLHLSCIHSL